MSDVVDRATRSKMMAGIRGKDTRPEIVVRRFLHSQGFRFRLHHPKLPGKPDIVLPRHRAIVDVRGCFWHCHEGCRFYVQPKSNAKFWRNKLRLNVERDARNVAALEAAGWRVLVFWECEAVNENNLQRLASIITTTT